MAGTNRSKVRFTSRTSRILGLEECLDVDAKIKMIEMAIQNGYSDELEPPHMRLQ